MLPLAQHDKFLYVFKDGPLRGPRARRHHRTGERGNLRRLPGGRRPRPRWLGARANRGRSKTAELAINDRHPVDVPLTFEWPVTRCPRLRPSVV
jgi:hypothetical protein